MDTNTSFGTSPVLTVFVTAPSLATSHHVSFFFIDAMSKQQRAESSKHQPEQHATASWAGVLRSQSHAEGSTPTKPNKKAKSNASLAETVNAMQMDMEELKQQVVEMFGNMAAIILETKSLKEESDLLMAERLMSSLSASAGPLSQVVAAEQDSLSAFERRQRTMMSSSLIIRR